MENAAVDVLVWGTRKDSYRGEIKTSEAICSAVVLVRGGGHNIIVDPGAMGYAGEVIAGLKAHGLSPSDVDIVVNTHPHLDHVYNDYLFERAVIYTPTSVWHQGGVNRVVMYPDITAAGIPVVELMNTPGHMDRHISVLVRSGAKVIAVAGDAIRQSIIEAGEVPKKYSHAGEYLESMRLLLDAADEIIPGHGAFIGEDKIRLFRQIVRDIRVL